MHNRLHVFFLIAASLVSCKQKQNASLENVEPRVSTASSMLFSPAFAQNISQAPKWNCGEPNPSAQQILEHLKCVPWTVVVVGQTVCCVNVTEYNRVVIPNSGGSGKANFEVTFYADSSCGQYAKKTSALLSSDKSQNVGRCGSVAEALTAQSYKLESGNCVKVAATEVRALCRNLFAQ